MKAITKLLLVWIGSLALAQGPVDPCLIINGQINPVSKSIQVCDPNPPAPQAPQFNVITNNCSATPGSSTYIRYTVIFEPQGIKDTLLKKSSSGNFSEVDAGWYKVIMYFDDGAITASDSDSVNVTFFTKPPVITVPGTPFAKCPSAVLNVSTSNSGLSSYRWYRNAAPGTTLSSSTSLQFNIANTLTSPINNAYTVEATDANGCKTSAGFNIIAQTSPANSLGPDIVRCASNTTPFTVQNLDHSSNNSGFNANSKYIWKGGSNLLSLTTLNPGTDVQIENDFSITFNTSPATAIPQNEFLIPASDYYVVLEIKNNVPPPGPCYSYDTILINITELPVPTCSNDTMICFGGTANISVDINGGLPTYNYSWDNGAGSASTASVSPTSTTTYTVTTTDGSGCGFSAQQDQVTVTVNPQLTANAGADQIICIEPAGTANLNASASGGTAGYSYAWTPITDLTDPNINNPSATPATTTTYTVTVTDAVNCTDSDNIIVNRYAPEIGTIAYPVIVSEGKPYTFNVQTTQNSSFDFQWTNLNTSTVLNSSPSLEAKFFGQDTISYEIRVTDPNYNCIARDTAIVWFISDNTILYVPNIFSPSAEIETNRRLRVYGDNLADDGFRFAIFNKWGQTVWETTNVTEAREGWDGGPQIEGVYTYIVEGKFKNDKPVTESKDYMGTFKLSK